MFSVPDEGREHYFFYFINAISETKKSLRHQRGNQNPYIEGQTSQ